MRNYLLFCGIFTVIVGAVVYFYGTTQAQNQDIQVNILSNMRNVQVRLLHQTTYRSSTAIDEAVKQNPKLVYGKILANQLQKQHKIYSDTFWAVRRYKIKIDAGTYDDLHSNHYLKWCNADIEKYMTCRKNLKKFYQDSILKNNKFDKNAKFSLDNAHEAGMEYFKNNYSTYTAAVQYTCIETDLLYWELNQERYFNIIANDLSEKATAWIKYLERNQRYCAIMAMEEASAAIQKPFEVKIGIAKLQDNEYISYKLNGQTITSNGCKVLFKIPSGKASNDLKTLYLSANITNPATGQTTTVKGEQRYSVFK
jgi:hypothetical protein